MHTDSQYHSGYIQGYNGAQCGLCMHLMWSNCQSKIADIIIHLSWITMSFPYLNMDRVFCGSNNCGPIAIRTHSRALTFCLNESKYHEINKSIFWFLEPDSHKASTDSHNIPNISVLLSPWCSHSQSNQHTDSTLKKSEAMSKIYNKASRKLLHWYIELHSMWGEDRLLSCTTVSWVLKNSHTQCIETHWMHFHWHKLHSYLWWTDNSCQHSQWYILQTSFWKTH